MYTAPEVFRGEQQSTKMDTFSFGKLLCELFTNRLPDPGAFPSMLQSMAKDWPLIAPTDQLMCATGPQQATSNELHCGSAQPLYQIMKVTYFKVKIFIFVLSD